MMTPKQRRNLIIAAAAVLLILFLGLLWWFLRPEAVVVPADPGAVPTAPVRDETPVTPAVTPVTPSVASAVIVARNFTERYGTYSTDVAFANITEVREFATPEFHAVLQGQIYDVPGGAEYQGRTTRAISTDQTGGSEESGAMTFSVTVQHELTSSDRTSSKLAYQTATVSTEKRGAVWLVSNFAWQ